MNRNPVLNSPDDITDELIQQIINNDLDSLTINYEFTADENSNPFRKLRYASRLRRIEFPIILSPEVHSLKEAFLTSLWTDGIQRKLKISVRCSTALNLLISPLDAGIHPVPLK